MAEFGEKLRKAREDKGMTQQSLADSVYVTRQTVSRWEGGSRYPDIITLKRISTVLGVGTDELLDNKEVTSIAEKNPVIEKPVLNNLLVMFYAVVVFTFAVIAIEGFMIPEKMSGIADLNYFLNVFAVASEMILFTYGLISSITGRMDAVRTGMVSCGFFAFEVIKRMGTVLMVLRASVVLIPFALGAFASYMFYFRKKNDPVYKWIIVLASVTGILSQLHQGYVILITADHLYTSMTAFQELLTVMIYILMTYQVKVLSIRRKIARETAEADR